MLIQRQATHIHSQERPHDMRTTLLLLLGAMVSLATGCVTLTSEEEYVIESRPVFVDEAQFEKHVAKYDGDIASLRKENERLRAELDHLKTRLTARKPLTKR